jgi:hypothetical protein
MKDKAQFAAQPQYVWTVIALAQRTRYMSALEAASAGRDIRPFTELLAELVLGR